MVLIKPGKDSSYVKNWRPITLLYCDYKVFTQIFCQRLKPIMGLIICPDQTGYVQGKFMQDNVMNLVSVYKNHLKNKDKRVIGFLDFEKAGLTG